MSDEIDRGYLGYSLLKRGFRDWFLYMFRVINNTPFVISPVHEKLFNEIQDVIDGKTTRLNINLCPRTGKTTIAKFLTVYSLTVNPKAQVIYTSYSQDLLSNISKEVASVLMSPIYKALYGTGFQLAQTESDPVNDFWRDYLLRTTGKATYSTRKIVTEKGGVVLFSAIGGQITGFGAGVRGAKGFSGIIIIDDANKVSDGRSKKMLQNTQEYFVDTLLTRLNNSDTPICNIQQRVHLDDLSGFLSENYGFKSFIFPLLAEDGTCNLPNQYTPQRIKELQVNNYVFLAQYQQQPIIQGGEVIKSEWFRYYPLSVKYHYKRVFITADTAQKVKECNDYSVFMVFGVTDDDRLHVLDIVRGKWEAPELKKTAILLWNKWNQPNQPCQALYVEDKVSGTGLIQEIQASCGIPILPLKPEADKLTRAESILTYLEAGLIFLPENRAYSFNNDFLSECESFTRDDSHKHDDQIDAFVYGVKIGISRIQVSILDVL